MEKKYLDENIFYVENFMSNKNFNFIKNFCFDNKYQEDRDQVVPQRSTVRIDSEEFDFFWNEFSLNINKVFEQQKFFYRYTRDICILTNLEKSKELNIPIDDDQQYSLGYHKDDAGYKEAYGLSIADPVLLFGAIFYINDNYVGGELSYRQKNLKIKPKENMLLVHSGSEEYEHGVTQVFGDKRYTIPAFIFDKKYVNKL